MSLRTAHTHKTRMMYFKFFALFAAVLLALIFMCMEIVRLKREKGDEYGQRAIAQLINWNSGSVYSVRPNRGAILDRNRQTLAYSTIVYTVFIDVRLLSVRKESIQVSTIENASRILGIPSDQLWALLEKDENGKLLPANDTNYKVVARQVSQSVKAELESCRLFDIYTEEDSKRFYYYDGIASQIIGFTWGDNTAWGLESRYNKELSGVYGRVFRAYDSTGRSVVTERVEPEEGGTVVTTLDLYIQQDAERLVAKYGREYNSRYAAAIVMNPNTGEVLAMAAYPSFSLNDPLNPAHITNPDLAAAWANLEQEALVENFYTIWKNFNITYTFEPGSIFKPITIAAALEEGIISEDDRYYCGGSKDYSGYTIHCHNRTGHGWVTVRQAIAYSCNVALMEISEKMGREIFYQYQRDFGYGERTGIDLPGEESASALLHSLAELNAVELATDSFGQRFKCTPIQAVTAFCALINGGYLYKPYIVSQITDQKNAVTYERKPEVTRRVLSQETSDFLRDAMVDTFEYGTGARAYIDGHRVGGKSGTAEQGLKTSDDYHEAASFVGYFPADNPQYVVLTVIYAPEGTTPSASYMFQELVLDIISYKRIPPTGTVSSGAELTMDDYRGLPLWQAAQSLNRIGLDFEILGNAGDLVTGQYPNPGDRLSSGSTVFIMVESSGAALAEVPDVQGMSAKNAAALITAAGFVPFISYDDPSNSDDSLNFVYSQLPAPLLRVTPGMEVRLKAR